jgi:thiol-disulfide isomerase/thioredoxin
MQLLAAVLAIAVPIPGLAQSPDKSSDKTEFTIELKSIDAHLAELLKATKANHGTCLSCYEVFSLECEKWADYRDGIENARRWARQAEEVRAPDQLAKAHLALADALLRSIATKDKEQVKTANEAAELYAGILADTPSDLNARFDRGRALAYAHREQEARSEFSEYIKRAPKDDPRITPAVRFVAEPLLAAHRLIPDVKFVLTDGREVQTSHLLGTRYIIDIWASWCGMCIDSIPEVHTLLADYYSKDLGLLSVSIDSKRSAWEKALKKYNMSGAQALDEEGVISVQLQASTIPRFMFVDNDGVVLFEGGKVKDLRQAVEATLGPKAAPTAVAQSAPSKSR